MSNEAIVNGTHVQPQKEKADRDHIFLGLTQSTCPSCGNLVNTQILIENNKVYQYKFCPEHGHAKVLVSSDADWYVKSLNNNKPGTIPYHRAGKREKGCPWDCGLCEDHQQHTCYPLMEITDHCNISCPICMVDNKNQWQLSLQEAEKMMDSLIRCEGVMEIVTFTGGEPTMHPQLLDLVKLGYKKGFKRVGVNSNGMKIATDEEFTKKLVDAGAYVQLQFDGFDPKTYEALRGISNFTELKLKALDNIEKSGGQSLLIATILKGLNDHEIGKIVDFFLGKKFIHSLTFQPVAFTGSNGRFFSHDLNDRMTLPDILDGIDAQTNKKIQKSDFVAIPCSHPACSAVGYFFCEDGDIMSIARVTDAKKMLNYLENRVLIDVDNWVADSRSNLESLWSASAQIGSEKITKSLQNLLSPCCGPSDKKKMDFKTMEGKIKLINVHSFMDEDTFDLCRAEKCCFHFALPDGRLMPFCAYNLFHRKKDPRYARKG